MERVLVVILLLLSATAFSNEEQLNWKKVKDRNGIQVYRAHTEASQFITFKSVSRVEIDNIQSFVGLFLDGSAYPKWVHMLTSAELLPTQNPHRYELYVETRLPWPVSNRFTKVDVFLLQEDDYSIRFELREPLVPAKARKGFILAPVTSGFYELKTIPETNEVELVAEIFTDPGGYIPAFLVNLITDDMSYHTARKLRSILKTDKYQNYSTGLVARRSWLNEKHK